MPTTESPLHAADLTVDMVMQAEDPNNPGTWLDYPASITRLTGETAHYRVSFTFSSKQPGSFQNMLVRVAFPDAYFDFAAADSFALPTSVTSADYTRATASDPVFSITAHVAAQVPPGQTGYFEFRLRTGENAGMNDYQSTPTVTMTGNFVETSSGEVTSVNRAANGPTWVARPTDLHKQSKSIAQSGGISSDDADAPIVDCQMRDGSAGADLGGQDDTGAHVSVAALADVADPADVYVIQAGPTSAQPGDEVTYSITVGNNGPDPSDDVTLTDTMPSGLTTPQYSTDNGATWNAWTGSLSIGTLALDETRLILLRGTVSASASGTISNTADVTASTPDPDPTNNTSTITTDISPLADLVITKTVVPDPAICGLPLTYTLTVSNLGPSTAEDVAIRDITPAGLLDPEFSVDGGITWQPWTGSYVLGSLAAGEEISILLRGTVAPCDIAGIDFQLIQARRGSTFRTIDLTLWIHGVEGPATITYLLLPPGSPAPDAQEVLTYADAASLTDGTAARGNFTVDAALPSSTFVRVITGKENVTALPGETGIVDGYVYDVYAVAVLSDGFTLPVRQAPQAAMGMPFDGGNGVAGDPFIVRQLTPAELVQYPDLLPGHPISRAGVAETARMLDNIEGMVVLYEQTAGLYGLQDTLADTFALLSDFDLSGYAAAYGGAGWRPIGNMNASLTSGGTPHIFTGTLQSDGPRRHIDGLPISETPANTGVVAFVGLFGLVVDAVIDGFDMSGAQVSAAISDGFEGHVGILAGAVQGNISPMAVASATATATASGTETLSLGGMVGTGTNVPALADITVTSVTLNGNRGDDTNVGGVLGRLLMTEGQSAVSDCTVIGAAFTSSGAVGGLIGHISLLLGPTATVTACTASGAVTGGVFVGGLIGIIGGDPARDPASYLVTGCTADVAVAGFQYVGGLIGLAQRATITGSSVTSGSIADTSATELLTRPFGGLIGGLQEGIVRNCMATVDVLVPRSSRAGGLIGDLVVLTGGFAYEISACTASGNVAAVSFIGGLIGGYTTGLAQVLVADCAASGSVTGSTASGAASSGGLIGSGQLATYTNCRATGNVSGRTNVGGFIGDTTAGATFTTCSARGNVTGTGTSVGGFVGATVGAAFAQCFCTGDVLATTSNAGGFVSNFTNGSTIADCYATGNCQGAGNVAGLVQGTPQAGSIARCYASGSVNATLAAGGVVAAGSGATTPVSNNFALNPLVAAGGSSVVGRVAASAFMLALTNNSAISTLVLTRGGALFTPTPGPNLKDGATVALADLQAAMISAGWQASVWDFSTIATLGRPVLVANPEV